MDIVPASAAHPSPPREVSAAATVAIPSGAPGSAGPRVAPKVSAVSRPLTEFSGDFFFVTRRGDELWFALGDFAGHGLSAAIYSAMIQEELDRAIRACEYADPAEVVATLDRNVRPELPFNRFASLVVGRIRPDASLQLANAGHCYPILRRSTGTIEAIGSHGPVVGLVHGARWCSADLRFGEGDALVLYSDGAVEAVDREGTEVSRERLEEWVRAASPDRIIPTLLERFDTFTGGRQSDDLTVMVIAA